MLTVGVITLERNVIDGWLTDHCADVDAAQIDGNSLTTQWSSGGSAQSVTTNRRANESDSEFKLRHEVAFLRAMVSAPPG